MPINNMWTCCACGYENDLIRSVCGKCNTRMNSSIVVDASVGRKNDSGKDRWDLLPLGLVKGIVKVLTFGAKKYAPNNWKKLSDPHNRYYGAMMRHLELYRSGEWLDFCEEHGRGPRPNDCEHCSGLPHLAHVGCNLVFLFHFGPYEESEGKP